MRMMMVLCFVMAVIAAIFYFLTGAGIITVPSLSTESGPPAIVYIAGGCYVLGGLLIFTGKRWLWITGLVINTLVVGFFYIMYIQKPDIMLSLPGLGTKIAQILLEAGLIYLIVTYKRKSPASE